MSDDLLDDVEIEGPEGELLGGDEDDTGMGGAAGAAAAAAGGGGGGGAAERRPSLSSVDSNTTTATGAEDEDFDEVDRGLADLHARLQRQKSEEQMPSTQQQGAAAAGGGQDALVQQILQHLSSKTGASVEDIVARARREEEEGGAAGSPVGAAAGPSAATAAGAVQQGAGVGSGAAEEDEDEEDEEERELENEAVQKINAEVMAMIQQLLTSQTQQSKDELFMEVVNRLCELEGISLSLSGSAAAGDFVDADDAEDDDEEPVGGAAEGTRTSDDDDSEHGGRGRGRGKTHGAGADDEEEEDGPGLPIEDAIDMHRAVFRRDLAAIQDLLEEEPMEAWDVADYNDNTPLLLAIKLGYTDVAALLVRLGANCDVRSDENFHLLDEAVLTKDRELVRLVYTTLQRRTWERWEERRPQLMDALENIPDFYLELNWNFEARGVLTPLVRAMAPSDTYRIWKKGSWLRMDSTIVGVGRGFRIQRGNMSMIFKGNDSDHPGDLLLLDRVKQRVSHALRRMHSPSDREINRAVRRLVRAGNRQLDSVDFSAKNLTFAPMLTRKGVQKMAEVNEWQCHRYEAQGDVKVVVHRKGENSLRDMSEEEYFEEEDEDATGTGGDEDAELSATSNSSTRSGGVMKGFLGRRKAAGGAAAASSGGGGTAGEAGTSSDAGGGKKKHRAARKLKRTRLNKRMRAHVWMAPDFPLRLADIMPALEVLALKDKYLEKLNELFQGEGIPEGLFPVKVQIPLFLAINGVVTFEHFNRAEVPMSTFEVPEDFFDPELETGSDAEDDEFYDDVPGDDADDNGGDDAEAVPDGNGGEASTAGTRSGLGGASAGEDGGRLQTMQRRPNSAGHGGGNGGGDNGRDGLAARPAAPAGAATRRPHRSPPRSPAR